MRFLVGAVFIYSGWEKLMSPLPNFMAVLEGYQILKSSLIQPVAFIFPWLELVFGTFLALGFLSRASASVLAVFLATFIVLLSRSLLLHLPLLECGCFGSGISLTPAQAIILDAGLLVTSFIIMARKSHVLSVDQVLHK
ncbi:MAG: DoxX family protein [Candidatus Omnitrophica bacterium]|nr:DoxX family protein [Candidatus Omnitrophota bacterium]